MIVALAIRNTIKNLPKRLPLGILFALTIGLLFLGNTIFENTDRGFETAYVDSFTGDLALTVKSDSQFTIFGSDLPMIGEYFVLPVLPTYEELNKSIQSVNPSIKSIGQVSAGGQLEVQGYQSKVPVFGVDFQKYFQFFPSLRLVKGSLEQKGSSLLLNEIKFQEINQKIGRELEIGEKLTLSMALENTFVIREVTFSGVYSYPVNDEVLSKIVLTDIDTARALNGYIYGADSTVKKENEIEIDTNDLDSLFDEKKDSVVETSKGVSLTEIEKALSQTQERSLQNQTQQGAWNFLILKIGTDKESAKSQLVSMLEKKFPEVELRTWRETAGGNAQTVWLIRLLFNAGIIFIALGSCLIVINSLALSIVERTKEIGTMRALGAQKSTVGILIVTEIVVLVIGAGLTGILLGSIGAWITLVKPIPLENAFLASLFGTNRLSLVVSWNSVASHAILCVVLGVVAVILPVRRALKIDPTKAMSRE